MRSLEQLFVMDILVCFLSLALWRTLEMWMRGKGLGSCARQLIGEIATVKSLDVVLPVKTSEGTSEFTPNQFTHLHSSATSRKLQPRALRKDWGNRRFPLGLPAISQDGASGVWNQYNGES
jgi:hypothetical protein